jgi:hypothetical protein
MDARVWREPLENRDKARLVRGDHVCTPERLVVDPARDGAEGTTLPVSLAESCAEQHVARRSLPPAKEIRVVHRWTADKDRIGRKATHATTDRDGFRQQCEGAPCSPPEVACRQG